MTGEMFLANIVLPLIRLIILFGLQIFLCRCKNKWLGLILPAIYIDRKSIV